MKIKQTAKLDGFYKASALTLALLAGSTVASQAVDISWTGATADYTNKTSWVGGVVPGSGDNAINDSGSANLVRIDPGNPDWTVNDIRAGNGAGDGAFVQNGQTLTLNGWFRLGIASANTGIFTLNAGTINYQGNHFSIGELGTGIVNMGGGAINGTGNFAINLGAADDGSGVVSPNTCIFSQTNGAVNITGGGQLFVGNRGTGIYNLSGGTMDVHSYIGIGRSSGNGTVNMTGGTLNQDGGGNLLVGTGWQNNGSPSVGLLNQSGGTINSQGQFLCPENSPSSGTYNLSGTGVLNVNNWIAFGRDGGIGIANISGGAITKTGDGSTRIVLGAGGVGTLNQTGGAITNIVAETWIGENSAGTWNLIAGTANLSLVHIAQGGSATGTLNLYTNGILITGEITTGNLNGSSYLTLDGGTIQASAAKPNFLHDIFVVNMNAGGVTFDTHTFDIGISQSLPTFGTASGGLTKIGAGKLTLSGANSYSGPTVVSAGTLAISTSASGSGDYSVANGADLSVTVQSQNAQLNIANLTLGTATVDLDLGSFGNPGSTSAPLNVSGPATLNGVVTLNIADGVPQPGEFPLISFASKTGTGSFALGTLPLGVVAHLNPTATSINLVIVSVNLPRWDGTISDAWDTSTANWVNIGTGSPTTYGNGNAVLFNDQATGPTAVSLGVTVSPTSLTFNNNSLVYSLSGAGKISGSTGLSKQGAGTASILNTGGNNFTGPVVISGGVLAVTNLANGGLPSALGAASANPTNLVLANGSLSYAGPTVTVNRGYSLQGTNDGLDVQGNLVLSGSVTAISGAGFTKTGAAQLTYAGVGTNTLSGGDYLVRNGALVLDGSAGAQTNTVAGTFSVAGATLATAVLTNTALTVNDNAVGNVAGSTGAMTVNSGTTLKVNSWLTLGDSANSVSTMTINGGTVNVPNGRLFLCSAPGTIATLNLNGGVINKDGDYFAVVDGGWNGSGDRTGTVNQVNGIINSTSEMWVAQTTGANAFYNLSGGTINLHNWWFGVARGGNGTFNMTGGIINKDAGRMIIGTGGGVASFNQSGGTINCQSEYWLGENAATIATNNISGTAVVNVSTWVTLGRDGLGVVNMSGGAFNQTGGDKFVVGIYGNGKGTWNQTGGSLTTANEFWIAQNGGSVGVVNLLGGTITNGSWLAIGREGGDGTLNISGGRFVVQANGGNTSIAHGGGPGTVNVNSGSIDTSSGETWIGEDSNVGTWNNNGGTATLGYVQITRNANATGSSLNLNGGVFAAREVTAGGSGTSTLTLNGGTLTATANNENFLHGITTANVLANGAIIDSGANVISIAQPLLDGTGGGGLTKVGNGTLYLNGLNTYTGSSLVSTGALGGNGTIAGLVQVAAGAKLSPGTAAIGTLTVNSLILSNSSSTLMKISLDSGVSNDLVAASSSVTYGGSLVVTNVGATPLVAGGTFHLFSAASHTGTYSSVTILPVGTGTFDPATGILTITSAGALTFNSPTVSGGNLILSGTGGTPNGTYNWLSATNLTTPVALWTTNASGTFGTTGGFTNAMLINKMQPAQFFRLKTP